MTDHPITPPPELVQQWMNEARHQDYCNVTEHVAARAAQWGADQELEACLCEVSFLNSSALADRVRSKRRPKPPTLKEQALEALEDAGRKLPILVGFSDQYGVIRRALEALPDD